MNISRCYTIGVMVMFLAGGADTAAAIAAFPGAEGFGAETVTGGRGGTVLIVNSLDDVNDGTCNATHCSFREAMLQRFPRIIVFSVAGEIVLKSGVLGGVFLVELEASRVFPCPRSMALPP